MDYNIPVLVFATILITLWVVFFGSRFLFEKKRLEKKEVIQDDLLDLQKRIRHAMIKTHKKHPSWSKRQVERRVFKMYESELKQFNPKSNNVISEVL